MGAYIKNFKMPPPGKYRACVTVDEFEARLTVIRETSHADRDVGLYPIASAYPTDSVPAHGRLIDADALFKAIGTDERFSALEAMYVQSLISSAPTIIPADPEKEATNV